MRRDKLVTIGELASGVAHEINNPLGFVSSNVSSMKDYTNEIIPILTALVNAKNTQDLEQVLSKSREVDLGFIISDMPNCLKETREGITRVLKIVADLKTFARDDVESKEPSSVNQILEGAVNILWNQIKYKAELVRQYSDLPQIPCFPSQLGQVFMNLLYNATQAIEKDGRIVIRTNVVETTVVIEIEDNGKGMESEVMRKIFDPFYTTKPRGEGTGLGLSIACKIVERHGGKLTVTSVKGHGTSFRVSLPIDPGDSEP